jgi:two-component system, cell cycle sensor histidine kinase and response regulator CckA
MKMLYVDGNPEHAERVCERMARGFRVRTAWVSSMEEARSSIVTSLDEGQPVDVIVAARRLPDGTALSLIRFLKTKAIDIPLVVITEEGKEGPPLSLLEAGAMDYLPRDDQYLARLPVVLEAVLSRCAEERAQRLNPLRVLYAPLSKADAAAVRRHLSLRAPWTSLGTVMSATSLFRRFPPPGGASQHAPWDMILCDYRFDGLDGVDLVKELLQVRRCEVPVVLLVEPRDEESGRLAVRLGAAEVILKSPGYLRHLPDLLVRICQHSRAHLEKEGAGGREEYLAALLENTSEVVLTLDSRAVIRYAGPSVKRLLGYDVEEVIGRSAFDYIDPQDTATFLDAFTRAAFNPDRVSDSVEARVQHKDGRWLHMEGVAKVGYDRSGKTVLFINARDITEPKAAELRVARSDQSLKTILDASPMGIGKIRERTILWVNEWLCRKSGHKLEELKGMSCRVFYESDEEYERAGKLLYTEGQIVTRMVTASGAIIDVQVNLAPADGDTYITIVQDVTAQKRAEGMLRLTQFSVDNSLDAIVWLEKEGRIIYVNDMACKAVGYARNELLSKTVFDINPEMSPEQWRHYWDVRKEQGGLVYEGRSRMADGTTYPVAVSSKYLEFDGREYVMATLRDVTERKKAEETLRGEAAFLDAVANSSFDGIIVNDINWKTLFMNSRTLDLWKIPQRVVDDEDEEAWRSHVNGMVKYRDRFLDGLVYVQSHPNETLHDELELIDGTVLERHSSPVLGKNGKYYGRVWAFHDITERKRAEEKLRGEAAFLEAVENSSFDGILVHDADWNTLFVNRRTLELWKVPPRVSDEGDMEAWIRHIDGMVKNREAFVERITYLRDHPNETLDDEIELVDGTVLERHSRPVLGKDGKCYGRVWAFHDITERKAAEQALWKNRLQLSEAMDLGRVVYWELDPESLELVFNDAFYSLYGTTVEEMGGYRMSFLEYVQRFVHPDDRGRILGDERDIRAHEAELDFAQFEHQALRGDGTVIHILSRSRNVKDETGKVIRVYGSNQDITELKEATEALKESERRYYSLFDHAPIGLMEIDGSGPLALVERLRRSGVKDLSAYVDAHPEFMLTTLREIRFVDVNKATLDLFESADKEEFFLGYRQYIVSLPQDELKGQFLDTAGRNTHGENETRMITKKGRMVHVHVRWAVAPGYEETHGRILVSFLDITARREAEERLLKSEEKYRDIFERAVEGIFQSTPSGDFISVNPAYARMFGYDSPEEFLASVRNVRALVGEDSNEPSYLGSLEGSDVVSGFEQRFVRKDGSSMWVWVSARAVRGADGGVLYHEGTTENVTERRQAEEERQRLQSQLRQSQKMEAIGTLAGGVAHDFNNILTVLTGYGTLLQMKIDKGSPTRMYVDQILSASQKAANLTHSLLAFSRQQPISLAPVSIDGIVKGTEKLLRRLLTEDITLKTMTGGEDRMVMADITQIDQILFNLVTNARDAMPRGGTLIIETKVVDLDEDFRKMHGYGRPGKYVLLTVSDTGTGMDEGTREQIFVPFFTTKEVGKGTGLGLSTVYGIVKQHGGYITLYSELGMGTSFHIYLPVTGSSAIETEADGAAGPIRKGHETILVAEDNAGVRRLVCEILSEWGYTVIAAEDGEDAIEKFRTNEGIGLLLFDSVMPKKNGREAYDAIRHIDPAVKVIFTSGYTRDIVLDKGIEEKRFDFISKPLQRNKLLEQVREVLDRR